MTNLFNQHLENFFGREKINEGEHVVLSSYIRTQEYYEHMSVIVFDSIVRESQFDEVLNVLNESNIDEIVLADHSTALMNFLSMFLNNGWNVSAVSFEKKNDFGENQIVNGLCLKR